MLSKNTGYYEEKEKKTYYFPSSSPVSITDTDTEHIETAVIRFVQGLGIRPNLAGYHLLIDAIMITLRNPELLRSLTKGLYPVVAKEYGKNPQAVERNMRRAIDSAYDQDPDRINSVFYYKVGKPYISEVLSMAVETLRFEAFAGKDNI